MAVALVMADQAILLAENAVIPSWKKLENNVLKVNNTLSDRRVLTLFRHSQK